MRTPRPWVAFLAVLAAATLALTAAASPQSYSILAGPAEKTLREFSRQAGEPLLFPLGLVRGVRTNSLVGDYEPQAALAVMLAGTELEASRDSQMGTLIVRRASPRRIPPTNRSPAVVEPSDPAAEQPIRLEPYLLQQRRDAGLITQTILRTDARAPLYHDVTTRREIEQLGVTSVAEFLTLVPGYSGDGIENVQTSIDSAVEQTGAPNTSGAFLKMRGFDSMRTAVLLNGRRLPGALDARGPDLTRVPLAAVERVEVLPFSGSAVYGQNVIGGAINIVLRKDYVGRSVTLQAGDSTQGGGREWSATLVQGFASEDRRTKATLILDYESRDAVIMSQRDFLARAVQRQSPSEALTLMRNRPGGQEASRTLYNYVLALLPSAPGVIELSAPIVFGRPVTWEGGLLVVPAGQDGTFLTPASFGPLAAAGARSRHLRSPLRRPSDVVGATAQIEHALLPDQLELYAELGYSHALDSFAAPRAVEPLRLSPADEVNPYRGELRYLTLYFDPIDFPDNSYRQVRDSARAVLGLRGSFPGSWRWTLDGAVDRLTTDVRLDSPNVPLNELIVRTRYRMSPSEFLALYNPFADHERHPISRETVQRAFTYTGFTKTGIELRGIAARVFGDALQLPAGPLRLSLRGEADNERRRNETWTEFSPEMFERSFRLAEMQERAARKETIDERSDLAIAVEGLVPLVDGSRQRVPLQRAELQFASRARFGENKRDTASTAALQLRMSKALMLRASVSEGYLPPSINLVNAPVVERSSNLLLKDPRAGGVSRSGFLLREGGNPVLRSETSVAQSAGLAFEPGAALSLFVDAWVIRARDGIRVPTAQEVVDHESEFPGRVEWLPPGVPAVDPRQFPGQINKVDVRPMNTALTESAGFDVAIRSRFPPCRAGLFTLSGKGTYVTRYKEQLFRSEPWSNRLGVVSADARTWGAGAPLLKLRGRATIAWRKNRWSTSLTASHTADYRAETLFPAALIDDTNFAGEIDVSEVGSSTLWDAQFSYDGTGRSPPGWRGLLFGDTRWTLGVRNLFDRMPPYRGDGLAFYSRFDDPRMRFIYLRVERTF